MTEPWGGASMTEEQWLACGEVDRLLLFVFRRANDRKRCLFASACCRQVWRFLTDKRSRQAVTIAERFVDGAATNDELEQAEREAEAAEVALAAAGRETATSRAATSAYCVSCFSNAWDQADLGWDFASATADHAADAARAAGMEVNQLAMLRCVFGNPFRSPALDPRWLTATVGSLAQAADEDRERPSGHLDSARLAVLADALEEVGCTQDDLLAHLRSAEPHVRGCWALDLVLGKE
jgi:hypothetical protein